MDIKEYQAKRLFKKYSIFTLESQVVQTAEDAFDFAEKSKGNVFAVKAQILAGGRGKGGGIKIVKSSQEVKKSTQDLLGSYLVTPQTSKKGEFVSQVLIEKACDIKKEYYLAFLLDPLSSRVVVMSSSEGGMDIEEVSEKTPEKILKIPIHSFLGFQDWMAWELASFLGLKKREEVQEFMNLSKKIYKLFIEKDANLIEINPLVKTKQDEFIALDAKMSFDENALYRQAELQKIYNEQEKNESEFIAREHGLSFISLDGEIACMVNGAGLAMATMDIIKLYGGEPANFLDVGGGAEVLKVTKAFEIILKSKKVKSILVNIFGGIMKCDVIATALIKASQEIKIKVPIIVRLEGTRSQEAIELLKKSNLNFTTVDSLDTAAQKSVELARG
ncbi:MAG: ADP-forming succinate--CoA ligase subunit beta [Bdellovibrionales bacterium]|nr:ADP-forming succinate--CoA ligase subunit beta [Bdellovibrionales bacterium]